MIGADWRVAATPHARHTYLPDEKRHGIALCLSGGGFRAALFHLGAIRRLYELGLLDTVSTIATAVTATGRIMLAPSRCRHHRVVPAFLLQYRRP